MTNNVKQAKMTTIQKILNFSLTKIIAGIIVCAGIVALGQIGVRALLETNAVSYEFKKLIESIIIASLAVLSYILLYRYYERRKITELSSRGLGKNLLLGITLGIVLQSLIILVIYLNGGFSIVSTNSIAALLPAFTMALSSAFFEEIIFRGIVFRLIEEKLGSYIALFISALIFGGLHIANPNSSVMAGLAIALQAGFLLGLTYMLTRNLWLPIALHFSWNFTQSGIFGATTSGVNTSNSLLTTKIEGSELLTGGQFGPEASIQATLLGLTAALIILYFVIKDNNIIKPAWKRK
jgi:membrane protease YdiL (CAAX protease family)